jgi:predicted O-methyltransferase YrrM
LTPKHSVFDFCFIDHNKDMYLPDLLRLERAQLIRSGTFVCADNIVFFRLDKYREHMAHLASNGVVTTRLEMSRLEYVLDGSEEAFGGEELRDGLGTLAPWPGFLSLFRNGDLSSPC